MDQRKADLLETQLLVEQLEQREQMLEAQNEMLQVQIFISNFQNMLFLPNPACFKLLSYTAVSKLPGYTRDARLNFCASVDGEREPPAEDHGDGRNH
jgi:hypothetical protein